MKAHELFSQMDTELASDIVGYFRKESREIYKTTVASLSMQRKLRPVFVQKKPAEAQIAWLVKTLKMRNANTVGEHLLQVWLLKAQQALLIDFLDAMEIEHDDEGAVENLPESIEKEKLDPALDLVLGKHDPRVVTLYMRVFQMQQAGGWPGIAEALESDKRLVISNTTAETQKTSKLEPKAEAEEADPTEKVDGSPSKKEDGATS